MFGKKIFGTFTKKAYSTQRPPTILAKTDLEEMVDSTPFHEATESKVSEGNKYFEQEAEKHYAELIKRDEEAKRILQEKKRAEEDAKRKIDEEEKKRKPVLMDIDTAPGDKLLSEPISEQRTKELPPTQLSQPLGAKKVYYAQIVKDK